MSELLSKAVEHLVDREKLGRAAGALGHFLHKDDTEALARFRSNVACLDPSDDPFVMGFRQALRDVTAAYEADVRDPAYWISADPEARRTALVELPEDGCAVRVVAWDTNLKLEIAGPQGEPPRVLVTARKPASPAEHEPDDTTSPRKRPIFTAEDAANAMNAAELALLTGDASPMDRFDYGDDEEEADDGEDAEGVDETGGEDDAEEGA